MAPSNRCEDANPIYFRNQEDLNINQHNQMKSKITFISRFGIFAVAICFSLTSIHGQDVSGHETVDNPHLRKTTTPAPSASAAAAKLSQKDQKFLSQIAAGGVQAVEDSKVAEKEGGASVKNVASIIVSERSRSNKELLDLAKKKGIGLGTDKIKARNMGKGSFDKQFVHTLTRDYEEDVKLTQAAAQSSDDKDVKSWAARTLPMLKQELNSLKQAK
jgi:putative membrane protein